MNTKLTVTRPPPVQQDCTYLPHVFSLLLDFLCLTYFAFPLLLTTAQPTYVSVHKTEKFLKIFFFCVFVEYLPYGKTYMMGHCYTASKNYFIKKEKLI